MYDAMTRMEAEVQASRSDIKRCETAMREQSTRVQKFEDRCRTEFQEEVRRNRDEMSAQHTQDQSRTAQDKDLIALTSLSKICRRTAGRVFSNPLAKGRVWKKFGAAYITGVQLRYPVH